MLRRQSSAGWDGPANLGYGRFGLPSCGLIPHASIKIYPEAAHGFLFQDAAEFASDVNMFVDR